MGFSFNPTKAITRALGLPDKAIPIVNAVFPVFYAAHKGIEAAGNALAKATSGSNAKTQAATQIMPQSGQSTYSYYYSPEPSGFSSFNAAGGYAPDMYNQPSYGEIPPWDYSTFSPMMQTVPASTWATSQPVFYQMPDRSSDLTELLTLALPLIL